MPCGTAGLARRDTLVVAGVSVRALAESARQGGWQVIALDLFGDVDTRRASRRWVRIGDAATLAIDPRRLVDALSDAAREPGTIGWVAGAGFDGAPRLLSAGSGRLALLGMPAASVRALRDARRFFATLDRLGLAHPPVRFDRPARPDGWLAKRAGGTGGWHIQEAAQPGHAASDVYYQRRQPGDPMSALFAADGRQAWLVALNRLIVRPLGARPYVYRGAVGPIRDDALQARVQRALHALVPACGLRGLASLDFILADGTPWLLEINPRPSASMVLHAHAWPEGLLRLHVQAVRGQLPAGAPQPAAGVRGTEILFASGRCGMDSTLADTLAAMADCHDLPAAGTRFDTADPVCSVTVDAPDPDAAERLLADRLAWIDARLTRAEAP